MEPTMSTAPFTAALGTIKHLRIPKHIAGFRALGGADDAFFFHHFDEAGGAVEADFEAALDEAHAGFALLEDNFEGFFKKGVRPLFIKKGGFFEVFLIDEDFVVDVFGFAEGFDVSDDALYFFFGDEGALHADREGILGAGEEHIAAAEEFFGADHVDDGAAVEFARDHEGDARGNVGFDEPGDDVDAGALGGEDEVDSHGAGHGSEAREGGFEFFAGGLHEVGELVDDNHDIGKLFLGEVALANAAVVGADVPHAEAVEHGVAALHFADAVLEGLEGFFRFGDDGRHKVGDVVVELELDDLRINEHEFDFFGRALVQDREDDGIDADGFARASCARDEEVGHLGEVDELDFAGDVLAESDGDFHLGLAEVIALDELAQGDDSAALVRHFDADGVLAGDGRDDAHAGGGEAKGDVVAQVGDLRDFDAVSGQDFEHGDDGAFADARHFSLNAELGEGFLEDAGAGAGLVIDDPVLAIGVGVEEAVDGHMVGFGGFALEDALDDGLFGLIARLGGACGRDRGEGDASGVEGSGCGRGWVGLGGCGAGGRAGKVKIRGLTPRFKRIWRGDLGDVQADILLCQHFGAGEAGFFLALASLLAAHGDVLDKSRQFLAKALPLASLRSLGSGFDIAVRF